MFVGFTIITCKMALHCWAIWYLGWTMTPSMISSYPPVKCSHAQGWLCGNFTFYIEKHHRIQNKYLASISYVPVFSGSLGIFMYSILAVAKVWGILLHWSNLEKTWVNFLLINCTSSRQCTNGVHNPLWSTVSVWMGVASNGCYYRKISNIRLAVVFEHYTEARC